MAFIFYFSKQVVWTISLFALEHETSWIKIISPSLMQKPSSSLPNSLSLQHALQIYWPEIVACHFFWPWVGGLPDVSYTKTALILPVCGWMMEVWLFSVTLPGRPSPGSPFLPAVSFNLSSAWCCGVCPLSTSPAATGTPAEVQMLVSLLSASPPCSLLSLTHWNSADPTRGWWSRDRGEQSTHPARTPLELLTSQTAEPFSWNLNLSKT